MAPMPFQVRPGVRAFSVHAAAAVLIAFAAAAGAATLPGMGGAIVTMELQK
jgi:hypothetical protein